MSLNIRSTEFPNVLTKMLGSPESVNTAMSLQGEDALTLVDILDQVSGSTRVEAPDLISPAQAFDASNMSLDLRRKSVRILRRVCGLQGILPQSCILSGNISKEGPMAFASGGFADVWKGRNNGNPVSIKAFRAYAPESLVRIKQVCSH